ncbi:hypothetical protein AHV22_004223 [Salmonella enterica subsp. enterica]|uniref:Uncharacterized protein n=2 Tax=Salmonella enterica TaxID=28901 RepID=A0A734CI32_SALET|nr:hypothetical protein [Salmonella enterica subsp. diarizonae]EAB7490910.1 hypothetical protein [Salmonella enterica subsp. enterica serovar Give]EAP2256355.1 hypothetical protein [Salmonella enterica]EBF8612727.1 hypothetical protein [Salmonella enterica subsp. enterica serovar Nagoya]EBG2392027.1 hypothetical protein [Salmonella enterica subsp. enterica serovar Cotham]EBS4417929.1 hypothetical protein [Salmonella enterica subsp. enterica serovar Reading]EBV1144231.1 hypothetical protein [S
MLLLFNQYQHIVNEIRVLMRNLYIISKIVLFWEQPFWNFIYRKILKHKFSYRDIAFRYERRTERRIRQEFYRYFYA